MNRLLLLLVLLLPLLNAGAQPLAGQTLLGNNARTFDYETPEPIVPGKLDFNDIRFRTGEGDNLNAVDVSALPKGCYIIRIGERAERLIRK